MYKCKQCGYVFEEPEYYSDDCTPGGAFEGWINRYGGCPNCAGSYELAEMCEQCGEWVYELEDLKINDKTEQLCKRCYEERCEDLGL